MPQVAKLKEIEAQTQGWEMGINLQDAPNLLKPTEARRAENGIFDERGGFTKRAGCQNQGTFGAAADRILSSYVFFRGEGVDPHLMIHTSAGEVYYTTDPTVVPNVWTLIGSGYSTTQPMSWETFNGKVYFCDGVSDYSWWDGAALGSSSSAPKVKYLRLWKDTMWGAGVSGYDDRVYSSSAGDAETWPSAYWVDIRHGDGDAIRALGTDGVYLIVGKRNTGSLIYDAALLYNRVYDYEKGIESHWSVIQHESEIFYLTRRGVAQWQGDAPASLISYKIDPLFDPHVLNYDQLEFSWAYSYAQKISWCITEIGNLQPTMQINYYPRLAELTALGIRGLGPWSFDRIPIANAVLWRYQSILRLYGGSTTTNALYWVFADNVGQDDGATFQAVLESATFDFGNPLLTKALRRMRVLGRGAFNMQIKRNFENALYKTFPVDLTSVDKVWDSDNWGDSSWGPDANVKEVTVNPDGYGRFFTLVFSDADPGAGNILLPIGSKDYAIPTGQWSILGVLMDGFLLGVRDN